MDEASPPRLARLGEAIEAFLEFQAQGASSPDALLEAAPNLREYLGPMLASQEITGDGDHELELLGGYRLVRELGRGGMGVVFEAIQNSLGRRVALKVMAAERCHSARSIERFRREASAAARLEHPGIVEIYGFGELAGRYVIVMEFVDGPSLAERLEDLRGRPLAERRLHASSSTQSYVVAVAELVARVADALDYAHGCGVVHRDIKPHNILLKPDGTPKLVDFGVAKMSDTASLSHTRELLGTPHYMSPEQADGCEDTNARSDVFSLGVVLYELLTLTRPFAGRTTDEILHAIRQHEATPLHVRDSRLPVELWRICEHALEKRCEDRYASTAELAADLRSFVRHEPISVHAPGLLRRARKFARRNRIRLVAAGLLLLGLGTTTALASEWRRAGIAAERVQTQRAERFAFDAVDRVLELLEGHLARTPLSNGKERERTREAVRRYQSYLSAASEDATVRLAVAFASIRCGALYRELSLTEDAAHAYARAADLLQAEAQEKPGDARIWMALSEAHRARMRIANQLHDSEFATREFEAARAALCEVLGRDPGSEQAELTLAGLHADRGRGLLFGSGTLDAARSSLEEAARLWGRHEARVQEDPRLQRARWLTDTGLAYVALQQGRGHFAQQSFELALAEAQEAQSRDDVDAEFWPEHEAECRHGLGRAQLMTGDPEAARHQLERALEIQDALVLRQPGRTQVRQRRLSTRAVLASLLARAGERVKAKEMLELARAEGRFLVQETSGALQLALLHVNLLNRLAATYFDGVTRPGDGVFELYAEALEVLELAEKASPDSVPVQSQRGATLSNVAVARLLRGELGAALDRSTAAIAAQRLALAQEPLRPTTRKFLRAHLLLRAQTLLRLERYPEACADVEEAATWIDEDKNLAPIAVVMQQLAPKLEDPQQREAMTEKAATFARRARQGRTAR